MLEKIRKLRIGGTLGVLVGIGLVFWVEPTTRAGQGLVLLIGFCVTVVAVGIARSIKQALTRKRPQQ